MRAQYPGLAEDGEVCRKPGLIPPSLFEAKVDLFRTRRTWRRPIERRVHDLPHLGEPPLGLLAALLAADRPTPLSWSFERNFKLFSHIAAHLARGGRTFAVRPNEYL